MHLAGTNADRVLRLSKSSEVASNERTFATSVDAGAKRTGAAWDGVFHGSVQNWFSREQRGARSGEKTSQKRAQKGASMNKPEETQDNLQTHPSKSKFISRRF